MDAQQQPGAVVDRIFVVANAGAIRGAHLAQHRPAFGHDLRDPKSVANFDQLAARNNDFLAFGQRMQH